MTAPETEGWVDVTAATFPRLHEAFSTISHDAGMGADHESYSVSPEWVPRLAEAEQAISLLDEEDFETFCIGDQEEMAEIAARSVQHQRAADLLSAFFNDWEEAPKS